MDDIPTLYVCHGDDGGPRFYPCRRVRRRPCGPTASSTERSIAAHGHPVPVLRKGSRDDLRAATGHTKLPTLKLADGATYVHSKAIIAWAASRPSDAAAG